MTSQRRAVLIFTIVWAALACYQYARTARICFDGTMPSAFQWAAEFSMLLVPLAVLRRARMPEGDGDVHGSLTLILLAYVPVTLALHLAERCASP